MGDESILSMWQYYEDCDISWDADCVLRAACRRAFYAGAYAMLLMFERIINNDVYEEEREAIVEGLSREWGRFVVSVATGEDDRPVGD